MDKIVHVKSNGSDFNLSNVALSLETSTVNIKNHWIEYNLYQLVKLSL